MELEEAIQIGVGLVAELSGIRASELSIESTSNSCPDWDSLVHMEVISALEAKTGTQLSREEMLTVASISGIVGVLMKSRTLGESE